MEDLSLEDRVIRARGYVSQAIGELRDEEHPDVREVLLHLAAASMTLRAMEDRHVGVPSAS